MNIILFIIFNIKSTPIIRFLSIYLFLLKNIYKKKKRKIEFIHQNTKYKYIYMISFYAPLSLSIQKNTTIKISHFLFFFSLQKTKSNKLYISTRCRVIYIYTLRIHSYRLALGSKQIRYVKSVPCVCVLCVHVYIYIYIYIDRHIVNNNPFHT